MRVRLRGLKQVRAKLADGTVATYFYAWRGGPRLPGKPGDPDFIAAYNAAVSARASERPNNGRTLSKILDAYQDSGAFLSLAPRTAKDYKAILTKIGKEFGDFPIAGLADRRARGEFLKWKDTLAKTSPRGADYTFAVFARALSWAEDRGEITDNPLKRHGNVWAGNRADRTWSDADEAAMRAECGPALRLALSIALWTAQRHGDILRMTWAAYDGKTITVKQGKAGKTATRRPIPVGAPLKALLDEAKRDSLFIVSHDGSPFTSDGFRSSWGRAAERAKIGDLTFHDLRGTFATRAYEAGATDAEVAAVTGHGADGKANATLRRHYLDLSFKLAKECIRKLEARTNLEKIGKTAKNGSTKD